MINNILSKLIETIFVKQKYIAKTDNSLKNKVVILTGNNGKIGSAVEEVLLKNGAIVVGTTNPNSNRVDITVEKQIQKLVLNTFKKYGQIDALINNAGIYSYGEIENISTNELDNVIDVNIKGSFLLAKYVVPYMKKQRSGTIINIGSKISRNSKVEPKKSLYALTKYAIEGFSFALNRELRQFGVRVICLMPGTVNTFFSKKYKEFMSPYDIAEIIKSVLIMDQIDFESIVFKSKKQDL